VCQIHAQPSTQHGSKVAVIADETAALAAMAFGTRDIAGAAWRDWGSDLAGGHHNGAQPYNSNNNALADRRLDLHAGP
jgi:hypothetical protein